MHLSWAFALQDAPNQTQMMLRSRATISLRDPAISVPRCSLGRRLMLTPTSRFSLPSFAFCTGEASDISKLALYAEKCRPGRLNMASSIPKDAIEFPDSDREFLEPHLPPIDGSNPTPDSPFVTLTFATSLDSSLALSPGAPTAISGPQSKAMTHYLRSRHDGILIGVGTAVADDPSLNCRLVGVGGYGGEGLDGQPRPIVVDPTARWNFTSNSKLFKLCREGKGRPPWVVTAVKEPPAEKVALLKEYGGKYVVMDIATLDVGEHRLNWHGLLVALKANGLNSVMIEGGGQVINSLLEPRYLQEISSIIVTIAPTWLGKGGVVVSPARRHDDTGKAIPAARLSGVKWYPFGEDVVLCAKVKL
ncbi:dihydrofolate reductase-like domain-containing protein [Lasiosphaeria miniovina]|uniref:2,5-diamino-6-ribosylamino-4(3H)-pyrimidinone 5'-phosphate reductase n=1 Tax=Lasiosphaeria miniovina TaxID=1954250 RepID=A0AA40ALT0_9PEZI|nr:dihydrofolate reductase-like domain-containing protein [Lasiosphaeria miniovina]KAK0718211.1 dihydrofolate reductase-like domain-containing protein [Lasiosphaeria miniovina]